MPRCHRRQAWCCWSGPSVAAALLLVAAAEAAAQDTGDVRLRFTGRVQVQFSTSSVADDEVDTPVAGSAFEARRVRLAADVLVRDWIQGLLEADYAVGNLALRRAFIDFQFDDAFSLRVGHFKRAFSKIFMTSSLETPAIERGLRIRGVPETYLRADGTQPGPVLGADGVIGDAFGVLDALGHVDYELGAAVHGEVGGFGYEAGVYNGTGQGTRDRNDGKAFAARGTLGVGESPLVLGAAASYQEVGVGDASDGGAAFTVDAEWGAFRRPGVHVIVEAVTGENHFVDESFATAQAMAAWFRPLEHPRLDGVEVIGRVSWGDPDTSLADDAGTLLTPGINVYLFGRNRLSLNWDVFVPQGHRFDPEHAVRAQAQFSF
jgi:hypothetical protein